MFIFHQCIGTIPQGFPEFRFPQFSFESDGVFYSFGDICKTLGSALYVAPLVSIIESIAIAKSFGIKSKITHGHRLNHNYSYETVLNNSEGQKNRCQSRVHRHRNE